MPIHAKNSDYVAAADEATERHEKREAKERFEVVVIPDQYSVPYPYLVPTDCTHPFDPQEHVRLNRAENAS